MDKSTETVLVAIVSGVIVFVLFSLLSLCWTKYRKRTKSSKGTLMRLKTNGPKPAVGDINGASVGDLKRRDAWLKKDSIHVQDSSVEGSSGVGRHSYYSSSYSSSVDSGSHRGSIHSIPLFIPYISEGNNTEPVFIQQSFPLQPAVSAVPIAYNPIRYSTGGYFTSTPISVPSERGYNRTNSQFRNSHDEYASIQYTQRQSFGGFNTRHPAYQGVSQRDQSGGHRPLPGTTSIEKYINELELPNPALTSQNNSPPVPPKA
jgi:hypothetical protein